MSRRRGAKWRLAVLLIVLSPVRDAAAGEVDVHAFARAPTISHPTLSPDGSHLSYVEQAGNAHRLVLRRLQNDNERRVLKVEAAGERFRWCGWSGARYLLCGTIAPVRAQGHVTERTRLHVVDAVDGRARELNARLAAPIRDQVIDLEPTQGTRVLLQHDASGLGYPEVSELDIVSGALRTIVAAHPPVRRWMTDGRGEVRLGIGYDARDVASLWVPRGGAWSLYLQQSLGDLDAIGPLMFGSQPTELLALKHHEGRTALFRLDPEGPPRARLLFADARYDVAGPVVLHPQTRDLLAVEYVADEPRLHFFSAAAAQRQARIDEQLPKTTNLPLEGTRDGRLWLIRSSSDVDPPSLYVFDDVTGRLSLIAHYYPELEQVTLAPMESVIYRARDGQQIPAYLTRPLSSSSTPLPAIVLPHGGPETRTHRGFDPLVQFLAAQGYAVLQMNFRGSLGYGARFAAAGVGQWGGVIHNDITDGARWLVEQGIADPERLCIVGKSFGGYAALLGAARESQWYACAASYAAPTDLMAFAQYMRRVSGAQLWKERLGENQQALWQMSPLSRITTIETPVLLMHGRLDPVVPVSQARRFARALRQTDKQHRYVERGDCDHDLTIASCRILFFSELQSFLAGALGSH